MSLPRRAGRAMLAASFISGGIDQIRNPQPKAGAARPFTAPIAARVPQLPNDPETLVKLDGAIKVAGGVALIAGPFARPAALLLAASLVPTTFAGHRFWETTDPDQKVSDRVEFFKNVSLLGGLLIAALDTGGRPSVPWVAGKAVKGAARTAGDAGGAVTEAAGAVGGALAGAAGAVGSTVSRGAGAVGGAAQDVAHGVSHRVDTLGRQTRRSRRARRRAAARAKALSRAREAAREAARETASSVRQTAREVATSVRGSSREVASSARESAREAATSVKGSARHAATSAREAAREAAAAAKERAGALSPQH